MWKKLISFENVENSWEAYCGPLSLTSSSGMPYLERTDLRAEMTL